VSISSTYYEQLFCPKVSRKISLYLQFVFVIYRQKIMGQKSARKMLVKLKQGLNRKTIRLLTTIVSAKLTRFPSTK